MFMEDDMSKNDTIKNFESSLDDFFQSLSVSSSGNSDSVKGDVNTNPDEAHVSDLTGGGAPNDETAHTSVDISIDNMSIPDETFSTETVHTNGDSVDDNATLQNKFYDINYGLTTFDVGGVGIYPFGYRLKNFFLIMFLAALFSTITIVLAYLLGFRYMQYILYAGITGFVGTCLYYIVASVGLRRRNKDTLSSENYANIYINGNNVPGKKTRRAYKHFNGAYYATLYSIFVAVILFVTEISFCIGLNYLGTLLNSLIG